ncbi:MAG TPA: hypothetical protein VKK61_04810, partial [Tepidisphaeraceae bacterium]|nr:hypothetical protein [Tepidisphaeraceae bacterium]
RSIHQLCPAIDIVGINSYGGIESLAKRYQAAGGTKPFIVTEFGLPGPWESPKNNFGASEELTSTIKGDFYHRAFANGILAHDDICLGGYAFLWGAKREKTETWFGMFLPDGTRLQAVDAIGELWSGKPPANRCPKISSIALGGGNQFKPGETIHATVKIDDPENDPLQVQWILEREQTELGEGGEIEPPTKVYPDAIISHSASGAEIKLPAESAVYRLYVYARDGKGGGAVANVPLLVGENSK